MGKNTGSTKRKSRHDIDMSRGKLYSGRLLKEINDLIERTAKSNRRKGSEISRTGEIRVLAASRVRLLYGFSVKPEKPPRKQHHLQALSNSTKHRNAICPAAMVTE